MSRTYSIKGMSRTHTHTHTFVLKPLNDTISALTMFRGALSSLKGQQGMRNTRQQVADCPSPLSHSCTKQESLNQ